LQPTIVVELAWQLQLTTPSQLASTPIGPLQSSAATGAIAPMHGPYWPPELHVSVPYLHAPTGTPLGHVIGVPD
jgi:hypothetical protein